MNTKNISGIILIGIGLLILLNHLDLVNFTIGQLISTWWPLIFVGVGLNEFRKAKIIAGSMMLLIGLLLQANNLDILPWGFWATFWPLLLILFGISLIFNKNIKNPIKRQAVSNYNIDEDFFNIDSIFSGVERSIKSDNLTGGEIGAVFGGVEIDFNGSRLSPDFQFIEISVVFGGADIIIPREWAPIIEGAPIFGGLEDKTYPFRNMEQQIPVKFKINCVFGGISIRY